jgi:hypothetical protein
MNTRVVSNHKRRMVVALQRGVKYRLVSGKDRSWLTITVQKHISSVYSIVVLQWAGDHTKRKEWLVYGDDQILSVMSSHAPLSQWKRLEGVRR